MVIWIIGISGSGKTFSAKYIKKKVQIKYKTKTIHIDGDQFRKLTNNDLGYDLNSRKRDAKYSKFRFYPKLRLLN